MWRRIVQIQKRNRIKKHILLFVFSVLAAITILFFAGEKLLADGWYYIPDRAITVASILCVFWQGALIIGACALSKRLKILLSSWVKNITIVITVVAAIFLVLFLAWNLLLYSIKFDEKVEQYDEHIALYVKNTFVKHGFPINKIKVLYLGVQEDFVGLKKKYEIDSEFKILFVGSFGFRKGAEYILKALSILGEKNIPYRFVLVGSCKGFEDVVSQYPELNIEFVGNVIYDELRSYYANSDVFLFPSLSEGSTRAGMEAMAAGLPVIVTDNCGLPVQNNINGIVVPIKNEIAIVDSLCFLYSSIEKRTQYGVEAKLTIKEQYTWNHYSENLLAIYKSILK